MVKQAEMLKRILYAVLLAGVVGLCYVGYTSWRQKRAMLSGEVTGEAGGSSVPDADGAERSVPLPEGSAKPVARTPEAAPALEGAPAADSMAPNPPNGVAYAGTGHFQVYRQGNLTYRINTDSGKTCVLYATNEEWKKPQVYSHGCGNSAAQ